jgi:hypothetical protein
LTERNWIDGSRVFHSKESGIVSHLWDGDFGIRHVACCIEYKIVGHMRMPFISRREFGNILRINMRTIIFSIK